MSSDINLKRTAIIQAYPLSTQWAKKAKKMSDAQVVAVYIRLTASGRIAKPL